MLGASQTSTDECLMRQRLFAFFDGFASTALSVWIASIASIACFHDWKKTPGAPKLFLMSSKREVILSTGATHHQDAYLLPKQLPVVRDVCNFALMLHKRKVSEGPQQPRVSH
jgi:hypothetical protein